jgi:glutathione S-transferase
MAADRNAQGEDSQSARGLSIYGYPQCPFCQRVLDAVDSLGLEIPLRNTAQDADHRRELFEAMGRATVPVLLVEDEGREPQWVPESADIVRYLAVRFTGKS